MFQTKVVEEIETNILCAIIFFFENCAIFNIMLKNILGRDRIHMIVWRMHLHGG